MNDVVKLEDTVRGIGDNALNHVREMIQLKKGIDHIVAEGMVARIQRLESEIEELKQRIEWATHTCPLCSGSGECTCCTALKNGIEATADMEDTHFQEFIKLKSKLSAADRLKDAAAELDMWMIAREDISDDDYDSIMYSLNEAISEYENDKL